MTKQYINHISEEFLSKKACITEALGTAAGSEKLYVNIDRIPPAATAPNITATPSRRNSSLYYPEVELCG